jgi:hypothetical protein
MHAHPSSNLPGGGYSLGAEAARVAQAQTQLGRAGLGARRQQCHLAHSTHGMSGTEATASARAHAGGHAYSEEKVDDGKEGQ